MTMTRSDSSITYEPDGVLERYAVPFPVFSPDDVHAVLVSAATETELSGFTVEGLNTGGGVYARFFTPPPAGRKLVLYRWTKRVQETDYPEGGRFPSKTVEQDFDKLTAMAQEEEDFLRTVVRMPRHSGQTPAEFIGRVFTAAEETAAARDTANDAAFAAAESAQSAMNSEENASAAASDAAKSASDAAKSANEAVELVTQGMPDGSETQKGIVRLATRAEAAARATGANGPAVLIPESLVIATNETPGLAKGDEVTVKTGMNGVLFTPGLYIGDIRLLSLTPATLPFGWYFCNGDRYPLESAQGKALYALPDDFKTNWGITVADSAISLPKLFHADGRGYFLRAVDGTARQAGSVETDAMQRITGTITAVHGNLGGTTGSTYQGAFTGAKVGSGSAVDSYAVYLDSSRETRIASETRALNRGMTPAIFLGV